MRKNIASQQGIATLLLTAIILSLALIVALSTYKNLFYQIKRAQNQVEARQNYWLAEGGVECGVAQYAVLGYAPNSAQPSPYPDCDSGLGVIAQMNQVGNSLVIVASQGYSTVRKAIITTRQVAAALQSTANLFMRGAFHFTPPAPTQQINDVEWECAALRFKHRLYINGSFTVSDLLPSEPPWAGFPSTNQCAAEYVGPGPAGFYATSAEDLDGVVKSIEQDSDMNLFEEFYGVPASDYESIKNRTTTHNLTGDLKETVLGREVKVLDECGTKIADAIIDGHTEIWVEGGCQITEAEYQALITASNDTSGVRIVVENGTLSLVTHGVPADKAIKGLLFLFNHDGYMPEKSDWAHFADVDINGTLSTTTGRLEAATAGVSHSDGFSFLTNPAFFQNGRFEATGGIYVESDGASAILNESLKMRFNRDAMFGNTNLSVFRMKKGSWYDKQ